MPDLPFPRADELVVMPDGRMNPSWYRVFLRMAQLVRLDPAAGDYSASMISSEGFGNVQSDLDAAEASIANLENTFVSAGPGLSGGGKLSADILLSVDINGLSELKTIDKAKDFLMILDATDSKLYKMTPTNLGVP